MTTTDFRDNSVDDFAAEPLLFELPSNGGPKVARLDRRERPKWKGLRIASPGEPVFLDLFAGGGGASEGIEAATGIALRAAVNHCPLALQMHRANHVFSEHFVEDVFHVDPLALSGGNPVAWLHASPSCIFYSRARSGKPLDRDGARKVRGLHWVVVKYAKKLRPQWISIENVEEFRFACRLGPDGRADMRYRGEYFRRFVRELEQLNYEVEHRVLCAASYGAPTIRRRLFIVCRLRSTPGAIRWPEPTHGPGLAHPFRTAAECVDWSIPTTSIFERKKPLAKNTLKRIARGLIKFVVLNDDPYIVSKSKAASKAATLVQSGYGERKGQASRCMDLKQPMGVIVAGGVKHRLVEADLTTASLLKYYGEGGQHQPITSPLHCITTKDRFGLVEADVSGSHAAFIAQHNEDAIGRRADAPIGTITTKGCQQQVVTAHLSHFYSSNSCGGRGDVRAPLTTITAGGQHQALVLADVGGDDLEKARRVVHFLQRYYVPGAKDATVSFDLERGLVCGNGRAMRILDVRVRLLAPKELFKAQGFPDDYIIDPVVEVYTKQGMRKVARMSKTEQIKKVGNSVPPPVMEAIVRANYRPAVSAALSREAA